MARVSGMGELRPLEEGWPCQRLRVAFGLILFFFFEILLGKKLPEVMPILCLGFGIACLASAISAIRSWKMNAQLSLIQDALSKVESRKSKVESSDLRP